MESYDVSVTSLPTYEYISKIASNPQIMLSLTIIIIVLYLVSSVLGGLGGSDSSSGQDKASSLVFLEVFLELFLPVASR